MSQDTPAIQLELAAIKRTWIESAYERVVAQLPTLGEFTADDLHKTFAPPAHLNWWGVLTAKLANAGLIRRVGARPSARPEANGRLVSIWRSTLTPHTP